MPSLLVFLATVSTLLWYCSAWTVSRPAPRSPQSSLSLAPQQLGFFEALDDKILEPPSKRKVRWHDLSSHTPMPFEEAWAWQKELVDQHVQRLNRGNDTIPFIQESRHKLPGIDTIIMLQHYPVFTLGTGSDEKFVLAGDGQIPVVRMDRGGEVTYHGPGQLTVYPILDLRSYQRDIHWYMRALEEAILLALAECGLENAERQEDVTGVWVENKKVAAVGIKCRKWISLHGLAVNVEESSLANFNQIVPCGLEGRKVGCVNQFLDEQVTVAEFADMMKHALEEVFRIRLVKTDYSEQAVFRDEKHE